MDKMQEAIKFASLKHSNQKRKGKETPYICHPVEVMNILILNNAPLDVCIAGVLHDTLEDTNTTRKELVDLFGEEIASMVSSESEDKSKSWQERKSKTIEELKTASFATKMICCADKLYNIRDMFIENNILKIKDFWSRFNAPKENIEWYYKNIIESLTDLQEYDMYKELAKYYMLVFEK